jgi:hypothetical protein
MTADEKQSMLDQMARGELEVDALGKEQFLGLSDALSQMFASRVWNCVDATAKKDTEWRTLSSVFARVVRELSATTNTVTVAVSH